MSWVGKKIVDPWCHGRFGRTWDNDGATIEGVGDDWVVIRHTDGAVLMAVFYDENEDMDDYLHEWTTNKNSPGRTTL